MYTSVLMTHTFLTEAPLWRVLKSARVDCVCKFFSFLFFLQWLSYLGACGFPREVQLVTFYKEASDTLILCSNWRSIWEVLMSSNHEGLWLTGRNTFPFGACVWLLSRIAQHLDCMIFNISLVYFLKKYFVSPMLYYVVILCPFHPHKLVECIC